MLYQEILYMLQLEDDILNLEYLTLTRKSYISAGIEYGPGGDNRFKLSLRGLILFMQKLLFISLSSL